MSEIIPILELITVDNPRCTGCYWHDQKNASCNDEGDNFDCTLGSGYRIWKEVTK